MNNDSRLTKIAPFLFISPGLLTLTLGFIIPLILLFSISFYKGIPGSGIIERELTISNYTRFIDPYYFRVLFTTFRISFGTTILSLVFGYPIALLIDKSHGFIRTGLLVIVLTPLLTNVVARTLGLMIVLGKHGPINKVLEYFNLPAINFIPSELGIVIGLTQVFMPYMILSISAVLSNIDFSLQEAARDLGSSSWTAFWKIIFPLSMPGIIAGSLFVFLLSFSSYVTPRLLGGGQIMVMTMLVYQQATQLLNWPFAAAAAFILLVFSILLVTGYSKVASSGDLRQDDSDSISNDRINLFTRLSQTMREWRYSFFSTISMGIERIPGIRQFVMITGKLFQAVGPLLLAIFQGFVLLFIILPLPLVILSSFSESSMITFPPSAYSIRWYIGILDRLEYVRSFALSIRLALLSMTISLIVGTLAGIGLVRYRFPGRELFRSIFLSPLMLPAVIVGISLLRFLVEIEQTATFQGLFLAHLILTTAYVVRTVSSSLIGFDNSLEDAARDLGAGPLYTFRTVTLPLIKPGIIVAAIFAFIVSFDETTVSIFITGGRTITLPVRIFSQLEYGLDPTVTAISSLMILLALIVISVIGKIIGLEKFKV